MGYLITQILIYLVLAAVIGFILGWVLRGARLGREVEALENELWQLRESVPAPPAPPGGATAVPAAPMARTPTPPPPPSQPEALRRPVAAATPVTAVPAAPAAAGGSPPRPVADDGRPIAAAAPGVRGGDDLKKIKGVGPKIEALLHDLGVYHYRQIADWTPENVAWVDQHLRFRGRIEREGWIAQARELAG